METSRENEIIYFDNFPESSPIHEVQLRNNYDPDPSAGSFTVRLLCKTDSKPSRENGKASAADVIRLVLPAQPVVIGANAVAFQSRFLESLYNTLTFLRQRDLLQITDKDIITICAHAKLNARGRNVYAYNYEHPEEEPRSLVQAEPQGVLTHSQRHAFLESLYPDYRQDVQALLGDQPLSAAPPGTAHPMLLPFTAKEYHSLIAEIKALYSRNQGRGGIGL